MVNYVAVKHSIVLMDVIPWQRNEGTLRLELRLADGVLTIDDRTYRLTKGADTGSAR